MKKCEKRMQPSFEPKEGVHILNAPFKHNQEVWMTANLVVPVPVMSSQGYPNRLFTNQIPACWLYFSGSKSEHTYISSLVGCYRQYLEITRYE